MAEMFGNGNDFDRKAFGLSAIAGMRSMAALALLAQDVTRRQPGTLDGTAFAWLKSPRAAVILAALALGEMLMDKTPFVPARILPMPLSGRMASGALVGAALNAERGEDSAQGAIRGAMIAGLATLAAYVVRMALGREITNVGAGLVEDGVVLSYGFDLIERP